MAVVIGAAFGAVVTSFVKDLITPIISALIGKPDFSSIAFTINDSRFGIGNYINALISFVLVAAAVYYFVVVPTNAVLARRKTAPVDPTDRACPECLSEIPLAARRCRFGTAVVA